MEAEHTFDRLAAKCFVEALSMDPHLIIGLEPDEVHTTDRGHNDTQQRELTCRANFQGTPLEGTLTIGKGAYHPCRG